MLKDEPAFDLRPEYAAAWGEPGEGGKRRPMAALIAERYGAGIPHRPWRQRLDKAAATVVDAVSTRKAA